jgi:cyclopropane fatty-acyl-phospholipid synthase-like methyltransferase
MKPADPARDYRLLVARGYDSCAPRFNDARARSDEDLVAQLQARLTPSARILDLGCGGLPVSRSLVQQHTVIGVDISRQQILQAQQSVPAGRFLIGDMTTVAFQPQSFDAVVSFYAIFHTSRATHEGLFPRIHDWLRPGGLLLASLAMHEDAGYTEDFFGVEMFWSNFAMPRYREMLSSCGFRIVDHRVISHAYGSDAPTESHPMVFAARA